MQSLVKSIISLIVFNGIALCIICLPSNQTLIDGFNSDVSVMGTKTMNAIRGGDGCTWNDSNPCDGSPEDCNGGGPLSPGWCTYDGSGSQTDVSNYDCKNAGEEQTESIGPDEFNTCKSGGTVGGSCTEPVEIVCYRVWTCPDECEFVVIGPPPNHPNDPPQQGYKCKDGTDSERHGLHQETWTDGECPT